MDWKSDHILNPAPGEIDPDRLLGWFRDAIEYLDVPEEVFHYIRGFDGWNIQNLLVYGSNMMPPSWPHDSEIDAAPNCEQICRYLDKAADLVCSQVCHSDCWEQERTTKVAWDHRQWLALCHGYNPDMDFRFATFHRRGNFYMYRSGHILKKFHVKRRNDGFWHITSQHTTAKEGIDLLMNEVITCGYWEIPLVNQYCDTL